MLFLKKDKLSICSFRLSWILYYVISLKYCHHYCAYLFASFLRDLVGILFYPLGEMQVSRRLKISYIRAQATDSLAGKLVVVWKLKRLKTGFKFRRFILKFLCCVKVKRASRLFEIVVIRRADCRCWSSVGYKSKCVFVVG